MFCWASFVALFAMLEPLLLRSYKWRPSWKVCYFRPFFCCPNNRYEVEFRQAILGLICLCPVIIWVVYRKASWAWTLQDSLGIIFSINMLRTVRLPSIKIIALLFTGLFIYDIFFVFITPLMTKVSTSYQILIINLQLKKYETAPYFFLLNQNLTCDCLLISVFLPVFD